MSGHSKEMRVGSRATATWEKKGKYLGDRKTADEWGTVLTLRRLMSYIYGAPILDVSRSHTTTQHSR